MTEHIVHIQDEAYEKGYADGLQAFAENNCIDEFDVELAMNMFTKRELAQMYVKKLYELEALKRK